MIGKMRANSTSDWPEPMHERRESTPFSTAITLVTHSYADSYAASRRNRWAGLLPDRIRNDGAVTRLLNQPSEIREVSRVVVFVDRCITADLYGTGVDMIYSISRTVTLESH